MLANIEEKEKYTADLEEYNTQVKESKIRKKVN